MESSGKPCQGMGSTGVTRTEDSCIHVMQGSSKRKPRLRVCRGHLEALSCPWAAGEGALGSQGYSGTGPCVSQPHRCPGRLELPCVEGFLLPGTRLLTQGASFLPRETHLPCSPQVTGWGCPSALLQAECHHPSHQDSSVSACDSPAVQTAGNHR